MMYVRDNKTLRVKSRFSLLDEKAGEFGTKASAAGLGGYVYVGDDMLRSRGTENEVVDFTFEKL